MGALVPGHLVTGLQGASSGPCPSTLCQDGAQPLCRMQPQGATAARRASAGPVTLGLWPPEPEPPSAACPPHGSTFALKQSWKTTPGQGMETAPPRAGAGRTGSESQGRPQDSEAAACPGLRVHSCLRPAVPQGILPAGSTQEQAWPWTLPTHAQCPLLVSGALRAGGEVA